MKTKKVRVRQGFTIVELVIVIGVIGVLTAVLIPTFVNLTNKAKEAADESLVKNLNTQLAMRRAEEGANLTMTQALADALDGGYKVENLTPKGNKDIVWNQETDEFIQLEAVPTENAYKYWTVAKQASDLNKGYSSYLYFQPEGDITVTAGIDVGEYSDINVTYNKGTSPKHDVRIRTRGGSLTINADTDTVSHWAELDDLNVEAVAGASYHEYGTVKKKAVVNEGHIVIENTGKIPEVAVKNVAAGKTVKVTANASTLITVDTASAEKTAVVANSQDVYVSGIAAEQISGSQASKVELPTVVTNEAQLTDALAAKKAFINIGANFDVNQTYNIAHKLLIDFKGYTIGAKLIGTSQADLKDAIDAMDPEFVFVNTPLFNNSSTLTLTDSSDSAAGGVVSDNNTVVVNSGTLSVSNVTLSGNLQIHSYMSGEGTTDAQDTYRNGLGIKRGVIRNESNGALTINSVNLYTKSDYGVLNYGQATIEGGTFTSDSSYTRGGYAYCVTNNGEMTINGGTILGDHGAIGGNAGHLVINNVTAKAKQFYGVYAAGEVGVSSVVINNGSFESEKQSAVLVGNKSDGGLGLPADVTINNGVFKGSTVSGSNAAVRANKPSGGGTYGLGFATINGGKYNSDMTGVEGVETCTQGSDGLWIVNA